VYPFGVRWSDLQIFDVQNEKMISHWSAESLLQGSVDALTMKSGVVIAGGTNAVAWNVETKQSIASFPVQRRGTVNCIQYLPESKLVALSHKGKKVRTYDLRSSKRIATVSGHNHLIHSFRLNGNTMATCSKDRTARVWDVRMDFALRSVLVGHTDSIHAIHLDPWRLLTGGRDHEVRLWDLSSDARSSVAVYESEEPVFTLVADESRLFTGALQLKMFDFAHREKVLVKSPSYKSFVDRMIELACGWDRSADRTSNPEDS
jgi:WD40 repeat protein